MEVIYGLNHIKKYRKPVVAIGVFDGLHLGHRRILEETVNFSRRIKGTSIILTFWPHPQKEESLYSLKHRISLIAELGIDVCIVVNFNQGFAKIKAEDFIKDVLIRRLGAYCLHTGRNFKFGRRASGNLKLLKRFSKANYFKFKAFAVVKKDGQQISSTYIRRLITEGKLKKAQRLLAKPVTVMGTVIRGISLARSLGFPTANIDPHHEILPPAGVYAVRVIFKNKPLNGACYIGGKPTLKSKKVKVKSKNIEVYLFDFKRNIYGKDLEIQFLGKIRRERKFSSYFSLARQIKKDIKLAQNILYPH